MCQSSVAFKDSDDKNNNNNNNDATQEFHHSTHHLRQVQQAQNGMIQRRGKRDKDGIIVPKEVSRRVNDDQQQQIETKGAHQQLSASNTTPTSSATTTTTTTTSSVKRQSKSLQKHKNDSPSGGIEVLLPSLIGIAILVCGVMAKLGFRGRATVCGIDLGTTNSVVCVQQQMGAEIVIDCIADPTTGSPVIPSVVSFLDASERKIGPSAKVPSRLNPHPTHVVVGQEAKKRIDSHPHHTLYNAKRILGRPANDPAISDFASEVEFGVVVVDNDDPNNNGRIEFHVPDTPLPITPAMVGSYVVNHLVRITEQVLGHANVKSAIICVPAKFNAHQRRETVSAFVNAGITVTRIVEEPTAAALAYGLHRKAGVDYILVYDFGGGTLDISLLHVSDGYVDVMGSDGDDRLGGTDFDDAIAHYLFNTTIQGDGRDGHTVINAVASVLHHLQEAAHTTKDLEEVLSSQCPILHKTPLCTASSFHTIGEQLKIELSNGYSPDQEVTARSSCLGLPESATTQHIDSEWTVSVFCSSLRPMELYITSSDYDRIAQPLFDRSIVPVVRLLSDLDLSSANIDEIVMVGGTTRMPQIRQLVQSAFPESQLNTHIDPDITVAYGAASVID